MLEKTEFWALIFSLFFSGIGIYITYSTHKSIFIKEKYFKYQSVAEDIITKLVLLEDHRDKLRIYLDNVYKAANQQDSIFIDMNDTFNKEAFENNNAKIVTLIYIYFNDLGKEGNTCGDLMSEIYTQVLKLDLFIKDHGYNLEAITECIKFFNKKNSLLGNKPMEISDKIKIQLDRIQRTL